MSSSDGITNTTSSASQSEYNSKVREQYEDREAEMVKRHKKQLAQMQKEHAEQIAKLQQETDQAITSMRDGNRKALSEREEEHLRQIEQLQDTSRRKLAKQQADDHDKFNYVTSELREENDRQRDAQQKKDLAQSKRYVQDVTGKDREREDFSTAAREAYSQDLDEVRRKNSEAVKKSADQSANARAELQREKDQQYNDLRSAKDRQLEDLNETNHTQKEALQRQKEAELARAEENYRRSMDQAREGMEEGLQKNREKFHQAREKNQQEFQQGYDDLRKDVNNRVNNKVARLEAQVEELKNKNVQDDVQRKFEGQREKKHYIKEASDNINELDKRRVEGANEILQRREEDIRQIRREQNNENRDRINYYTHKLDETKRTLQDGAADQIDYANRDRDAVRVQAKVNMQRTADAYADKMKASTEFQADQIATIKNNFEESLGEQRETEAKVRDVEKRTLVDKSVKTAQEMNNKLNDTIQNYERKLSDLRQDYEKRLRHQEETFKQRMTVQLKAASMDRESMEDKAQARINEIKNTYESQIEQLQRRQAQERLDLAKRKT